MGRFRSLCSAQRFLSAFARACNLFCPRRHLFAVAQYRSTMESRFRYLARCCGARRVLNQPTGRRPPVNRHAGTHLLLSYEGRRFVG